MNFLYLQETDAELRQSLLEVVLTAGVLEQDASRKSSEDKEDKISHLLGGGDINGSQFEIRQKGENNDSIMDEVTTKNHKEVQNDTMKP